MENMDKGLTVPKWVLIVYPKMPKNLSARFVCQSPKVLDFNEKRLYWASVVWTHMSYLFDSKHHQGNMLQLLIPKIRTLNF